MANKFTQSVLERQYKEAQDEKRNQRLSRARTTQPNNTASKLTEQEISPPETLQGAPVTNPELSSLVATAVPDAAADCTEQPVELPREDNGVNQNLEQPTELITQVVPEEQQAAALKEAITPDVVPSMDATEKTPAVAARIHTNAQAASDVHNLDAYIVLEEERVAKNKTFYLDQAVIDAVKAAAKRRKITDSKLVNDILRKVLAL